MHGHLTLMHHCSSPLTFPYWLKCCNLSYQLPLLTAVAISLWCSPHCISFCHLPQWWLPSWCVLMSPVATSLSNASHCCFQSSSTSAISPYLMSLLSCAAICYATASNCNLVPVSPPTVLHCCPTPLSLYCFKLPYPVIILTSPQPSCTTVLSHQPLMPSLHAISCHHLLVQLSSTAISLSLS